MNEKTHLRISRIRIKHIAKKLARNRNARNNQPMYIIRVNHKRPAHRVLAQLRHAVKVHEQRKKDMVRGGAVLEDAQEVRLEGDGGDVARVEGERGCGRGDGVARGGGERVEEGRGVGGVYGRVRPV